jgi:ATP-dependent Clp protease ATP-binding subunit ClpA
MTDDSLEIPDFLRILAADRAAAWREFMPPKTPAVDQAAAWQRLEQARREAKAEKTRERIAALKAKKAATTQHDAIPTSKRRWCVNTSKWVAA